MYKDFPVYSFKRIYNRYYTVKHTILSGVGPIEFVLGVNKIAPGVMLTFVKGCIFSLPVCSFSVRLSRWQIILSEDFSHTFLMGSISSSALSLGSGWISSSSRIPSNSFRRRVEFDKLLDSSPAAIKHQKYSSVVMLLYWLFLNEALHYYRHTIINNAYLRCWI